MKRKLFLIIAMSLTFILTACSMTTEEIDTALMQLNATYQGGAYEQALTEVKTLDKSSKKMSEEQKSKFDELKSSLEYAISYVQAINDGFNRVQSYCDQKMYYEAQQELDKISQNYKLPPTEQKKFDEQQGAVSKAITSWKITETIQRAETTLNSNDYNSASKTLSEIDASNLTEEQKQKITSLNEKIASAKAEDERKKAKAEQKKKENSMPAYIREIKDDLGVPSSLDVTYKISEPYYWSGGGQNLISVDFYHNGQHVAGVEVDAVTHEHIRGISMYTEQQ